MDIAVTVRRFPTGEPAPMARAAVSLTTTASVRSDAVSLAKNRPSAISVRNVSRYSGSTGTGKNGVRSSGFLPSQETSIAALSADPGGTDWLALKIRGSARMASLWRLGPHDGR